MPNNPTHDPVTGREIGPDDDYDYVRDPLRNDPRRALAKDTESVHERQQAAKARGEPYYPTPWECQEMGKWWNVPEDEQRVLVDAETAEHPWQEIIEQRLTERGLYHGRPGEEPTPWDGSIAEATNWGNIVTVTRIGVQWLRLNPDALGRGTNATKAISAIMRKLGWTLRRVRVSGMTTLPKIWVEFVPNAVPNAFSEGTNGLIGNNLGENGATIRTDDDDIPF